jgi:hypothetical protein
MAMIWRSHQVCKRCGWAGVIVRLPGERLAIGSLGGGVVVDIEVPVNQQPMQSSIGWIESPRGLQLRERERSVSQRGG